jgi:hypothetical protein
MEVIPLKSLDSTISKVLKNNLGSQNTTVTFHDTWDGKIETKRNRKKVSTLIAIPMLLLLSVGFSYLTIEWYNTQVNFQKNEESLASMVTPLETFDELFKQEGAKEFSLEESKKLAVFPVRSLDHVEGMKRVKSAGLILPHTITEDDKEMITDGQISYFELFAGSNAQRMISMQSPDEDMTLSSNGEIELTTTFPQGSMKLDQFKNELALMIDLGNNRKQLVLFVKEQDETISRIDIWGKNVDDQVLIKLGKDYLSKK